MSVASGMDREHYNSYIDSKHWKIDVFKVVPSVQSNLSGAVHASSIPLFLNSSLKCFSGRPSGLFLGY